MVLVLTLPGGSRWGPDCPPDRRPLCVEPEAGPDRRVVSGPGVAYPKSRRSGCEPAALESESFPGCPPGPSDCGRASSPGVVLQTGVNGVADVALEGAGRLFAGLALGQLVVEVGAALAVLVADLGDRGHVDGVIDAPVPAPRQPVDPPIPRRHLDGRCAVVGGEAAAAGEPGHLAGGADHGGGDDRAGTEDPRQAGARCLNRRGELVPGVAQLGIKPAQ